MNYKKLLATNIMILVLLLPLIINTIHIPVVTAEDAWWNDDYSDRKTVWLNARDISEELTDFVVMLHLGPEFDWYITQDDGDDVRFASAAGVEYKYELANWINGTGAWFWIKVPTIIASNVESNYFYMYFGNSTVSSGEDPTDVWSEYVLVHHIEEASGTVYDQSASNRDGTDEGNFIYQQTGLVGYSGKGSIGVDDAGYRILDQAGTVLDFGTSNMTIEVAVKGMTDLTGDESALIYAIGNSGGDWRLELQDDTGKARFWLHDGSNMPDVIGTTDLYTNNEEWAYIVAMRDTVADKLRIYVNGIEEANVEDTAGSIRNNPDYGFCNSPTGGSRGPGGYYDEVRMSNMSRSDEWIEASNLNYFGLFAMWGPVTVSTVISNIEISTVTGAGSGTGNWVFANERYYHFNATYQHITGYEYLDTVKIYFTDGVNLIGAKYDTITEEFTLDNAIGYGAYWSIIVDNNIADNKDWFLTLPGTWWHGYEVEQWRDEVESHADEADEVVQLKAGDITNTITYLNVIYDFFFKSNVLDVVDVDIWLWSNDTLGASTAWTEMATDYFNIYNLGGLSALTSAGAAGRTVGGDVFELYAGTDYVPADILDENFEKELTNYPSGWWMYQPDDTVVILSQNFARDPSGGNLWNFKLTDSSATQYAMITSRTATNIDGNFTWQTYVRLSQTTGYFYIEGETYPYRPIVVQFNTTGHINYFASGGVKTYVDTYAANTWYNITLVISVQTDTYDIYKDTVLKVDDGTFWTAVSEIENIEYLTSWEHPASTGVFQIDDVKIWKDWAGGNTGWVTANTTFRKLQHVRMLVEVNSIFEFDSSGYEWLDYVYHWLPDVGSWYVGMDYCTEDGWISGWYAKITPIAIDCNNRDKWMKYSVEWYYRGVLIKNNTQTSLVDMDRSELLTNRTAKYSIWIDLWFNKINASTTIGGRINSEYWGMSQKAPWWRSWWGTDWKVRASAISESMLFQDLVDGDGEILSSTQIKLMRVWMRVNNTEGANPGLIQLRSFDRMVWTHTRGNMEGVNTPEPEKTRSPDMPDSGFIPGLIASLKRTFEGLSTTGLSLWNVFIGFMDTIGSWLGFPNMFSNFIAYISDMFSYIALGMANMGTMLTQIFTFFTGPVLLFLGYIGRFFTTIITTLSTMVDIMQGVVGGGVNILDYFGPLFAGLITLFFVFSVPVHMLNVFATKGIGGVWRQVNAVMNVLIFFINLFMRVVNFVTALISRIIEAVPVIE